MSNPRQVTPTLFLSQAPVAQGGAVPSVGFFLTLILIFLTFNRIIELMPHALAVLRPALMLLIITALIAALSGSLGRMFSSRILLFLLLFTAWAALGLPFSVWVGGTARTLLTRWIPALWGGVTIVLFVTSMDQNRKAFNTVAIGTLAVVGLGFFMASTSAGRAIGRLGFDMGTLKNPNDLASILLMGMPFCILAAGEWKGIRKVVASVGTLLMVVMVFRTGSRAGLLALLLLGVLLFLGGSIGSKIKVVMISTVLAAIVLTFSGRTVLDRYRTLIADSGDQPQSSAEAVALASSTSRTFLFKRSLWQTLHHPVLGVGMGMFMVAESNDHSTATHRAAWLQTHNTFTQLSSETGIPGLIFYAAAILLCLLRMRAVRKATRSVPELRSLNAMASAERLSLLMFIATGLFGSNAYYCYFPTLAGLAVSLDLAAWKEIRAFRERVPSARTSYPIPTSPRVRAYVVS